MYTPLHMVLDEVEDVFEGQLEPDPPVVGLSG